MDVELPDQVPTAAAIAAAQHAFTHGHDGVDPVQHFLGALADNLGLTDPELAAAEQAVVKAIEAHPRNQAQLDMALADLDRLKQLRTAGGKPPVSARRPALAKGGDPE